MHCKLSVRFNYFFLPKASFPQSLAPPLLGRLDSESNTACISVLAPVSQLATTTFAREEDLLPLSTLFEYITAVERQHTLNLVENQGRRRRIAEVDPCRMSLLISVGAPVSNSAAMTAMASGKDRRGRKSSKNGLMSLFCSKGESRVTPEWQQHKSDAWPSVEAIAEHFEATTIGETGCAQTTTSESAGKCYYSWLPYPIIYQH